MKSGLGEQEIFNSAVQKIGQAQTVQNEFKKVEATIKPMQSSLSFAAPWDAGVKLLTIFVSGILGYYILSFIHHRSQLSESDFLIGLVLPLCLLGLGLALMVTSYVVDADGILIRRLFWQRRIRRDDIMDVSVPSAIFGHGIGLCGIWGFCGKSGFAYSNGLGFHIVAASGSAHRVVITRRHRLPIVISPSDSQAFIHAFNDNCHNAA
jgi:hypothetical protein